MNELRVCFVGLGSIARRHIHNLHDVCQERGIKLYVDVLRRAASPLGDVAELVRSVYLDINGLPKDYDVIFLTNPTEFHLDALRCLHDNARHFFIEKPLTSIQRIGEINTISYRSDCVYYIACPLRYTDVIRYVKETVDIRSVMAAQCICSSYLPSWRPGIDYRKTYSANRSLGGGVSIDLIHEWDYLRYLFGMPERVVTMQGKKSSLEMDCEDVAAYLAEYPDKLVELHLDYFGRKTLRQIMLFTDEDTIMADLANSKVRYLVSGREITFPQTRDSYQKRELHHFLDMISGAAACDNTITDACQTLYLTQGEIR